MASFGMVHTCASRQFFLNRNVIHVSSDKRLRFSKVSAQSWLDDRTLSSPPLPIHFPIAYSPSLSSSPTRPFSNFPLTSSAPSALPAYGDRSLPRRTPRGITTAAVSTTPVVASSGWEFEALEGIPVYSAATGATIPLESLLGAAPGEVVVVAFLTHFADLSSWEFAQKLVEKVIPTIATKENVRLVAIGLGSVANAKRFSEVLKLPGDLLYADPEGTCYTTLGFSRGFGPDVAVNPYLKLLPMLMGIGSPGTIQEVLRGYVGDRDSKPVFSRDTPFDILGKGYQRPFELATLRLFNMAGILPLWGELSPPKTQLLTQQGGTLVFSGRKVIYKHVDTGILKYTPIDELLKAIVDVSEPASLPL
eukprot:TRINITY_DN35867_c0_g1_i1.p1 TRINITY_DN35867_c0_g1~~TRINITY_DN35867_c0_g1_i1.p1  ORF type:complete len:363 (+),score=44.93 TRINITY_DN35867_c0_g1_i1:54-1142(+)